MTLNDNLFGEKVITIKGDSFLNGVAQHIYDLWQHDNSIATGESIGQINRKIHLAIMMDSGLSNILNCPKMQKESFTRWYLSKECPTEEETARATRGLVEAGHIPIPRHIIVKAEQFRARIASKMR